MNANQRWKIPPFLLGGLLNQEIGNLIIYNLLVWPTFLVLIVFYFSIGGEQRVFLVDGLTRSADLVPYYSLGTEETLHGK